MSTELTEAIAELRLVDHHVHAPLAQSPSRDDFEQMITESDRPAPAGTSQFDSQVGFAVRRHCAPLVGTPPLAAADNYWAARSQRSEHDLARDLLQDAGVDAWLVDTGFAAEQLMGLDQMRDLEAGRVHEIVRLETVLEELAPRATAAGLHEQFDEALTKAAAGAAGLKSIIAYRHGLDFEAERPSRAEVTRAAETWLASAEAGKPRVSDPVLLRMLLWAGVDTGLPLQLHTGYGDPDLDLRRCDPLHLAPWLKAVEGSGSDVMLLHCYPYHRNAGFLAQAFPHVFMDIGLAINYTGAASDAVIHESLELAPFGKVLYSSDAWGPAELHHLGAKLWRRGMSRVLGAWVDEGEWSLSDAVRVATMMGRTNAQRVYGLSDD